MKRADFWTFQLLALLLVNPALDADAQAQADHSAPGMQNGETKDSEPDIQTTLKAGIAGGKILLQIKGDGVSTASVRAILHNQTSGRLKVAISPNEVIQSSLPGTAKLMVTDGREIDVPANEMTVIELPTVSVSPITTPAPLPKVVTATSCAYGNTKLWHQFASIIAAAKQMGKAHAYDKLPLKINAQQQVTQLAIWKVLGIATHKPQDAVTAQKIGNDVLKEISEKIKKDPGLRAQLLSAGYKITPQGRVVVPLARKKSFDERANAIYHSVDETIKRSQDTRLKELAPLPDAALQKNSRAAATILSTPASDIVKH